ncbi:MAG: flagellar basal-body rod protein FlgG [Phycisphaeraceae bacterium]|nr:MAG: flagellar basal-body rod protein FlgG [Phycisphaeraceae bacterium]
MAIIALNSASSGLTALNTQLDVISNNLANINTAGYKASRVNFQDLLYIEKQQPGVENANGDQRPTGLYVGLGVRTSGTQQSFEQGSPEPTGNALDFMIDGRGFFQVQVEDDLAPSGTAFTRAGNFTLNADGEVVLANSNGRRLIPTITIDPEYTNLDISSDGRIFVQIPGEAEPQEVAQIELADFANPSGLRQIGENLWSESASSGPPITGEPSTSGRGSLSNRMLERSNVDPTRELIGLILTQRAFEMNSQSIRAADEALQTISQLRR